MRPQWGGTATVDHLVIDYTSVYLWNGGVLTLCGRRLPGLNKDRGRRCRGCIKALEALLK